MTDRRLGSLMIAAGIVLIGLALAFGSYLRPLELTLGAVLVGTGLFARHHRSTNADRPEARDASRLAEAPSVSSAWPGSAQEQSDAGGHLHDAFAVVQEGGRLRAVDPSEIDGRFAPVLARWQRYLPLAPGSPGETVLRRHLDDLVPELRRDVMELEHYLDSLSFKRQAAQERYFRKLDELDALLHAAGDRAPVRTLIFKPRDGFFDGWHRAGERTDNAGEGL